MSSLLIIGELGEPLPMTSQAEFQSQYLSYIKAINQDPKDIMIYNSKGQLIQPKSNIDFSSESRYFIFSKSYPKESFNSIIETSIHKLSCQSQISLNTNNLPDVHSNHALLEDNAKILKGITPLEIKETYERMLEFYENFKVFDTSMKLNKIICEKIKGNYQYQYCGINALIKNMSILIENTGTSLQDLKAEYGKMANLQENNIKNLSESIEKLKTCELHPKMQTQNKKYLIDVYYDEKKMMQNKDKLVNQAQLLYDSIQDKINAFHIENNKVLNEKSTSISDIRNEWSTIENEYDKTFKEVDNLPMNIFNELSNEFLQFKKSLAMIIEILSSGLYSTNISYSSAIEEAVDVIRMLKLKYSNFSLFGALQRTLDAINNSCSKMRKSMDKFPQRINTIFNNFNDIKITLIDLTEKMAKDKKNIDILIESFSSFKYASLFPQAYQASLNEVKRRLLFDKRMQNDIDILKKSYSNEVNSRNKFIQQYGKFFPMDFFRILKFYELTFNAEFKTDEINELPNLLTEEDEKTIGSNILNSNNNNQQQNQAITNNAPNAESSGNQEKFLNEIDRKDNIIKQLQYDLNSYTLMIQKISDDYLKKMKIKDECLTEKINECDNLAKYINSKYNSQLENCPMCNECALNSSEYESCAIFISEMKQKYHNKEKEVNIIEGIYQESINQMLLLKKTFFNHMNTIIAYKNMEVSNLTSLCKGRMKNLEDLLMNERRKCSKDININDIDDKNQLDKQLKECNRIIATYQNDNLKKQKIIDDDKSKYDNLINENNTLKERIEETKGTIQQLIDNSDLLAKKFNVSTDELIKVMKMNTMLQGHNEALSKELLDLKNHSLTASTEINKIKEREEKLMVDLLLQKQKYEEIIKEKDMQTKELISILQSYNKNEKIISQSSSIASFTIEGSNNNNDEIISYKKIAQGLKCIFVPHSEGVYVCVNLSEKYNGTDNDKKHYFKCKYILNLDTFNDDLKELIIENSLIIIGTIGSMNHYSSTNHNNKLLPNDSNNIMVSLSHINYIIGFPEEDLFFRNYATIE